MGSPLVVGVALYKFFWGVSLFSHYFTRADFNPVNCPILFLSSNFYKCSTGVWDNRDNLRILALIMCLRGRLRESLGFTLRIYILDPYIIFTANRIKCLGLINQPIHGIVVLNRTDSLERRMSNLFMIFENFAKKRHTEFHDPSRLDGNPSKIRSRTFLTPHSWLA